jgi:hypothetical protein
MRDYVAFNRAEITSGTLAFIQDAKGQEIIDRIIDQTLQPGIWMPANATAEDIQNGLLSQFIITDAGGGNINVAAGVAYNVFGERIEVEASDTTPYNVNAPSFTTTITGVGNIQGTTPFSTGVLTIPPPSPGVPGLRFVFIQYQQVEKTKALPPNHGTSSGSVVTIGGGDPDSKKPILELDQKTGQIYAPQFINGYKITVTDSAGITVPGGTNVPLLSADQQAIFIGRYELLAGPAVTNIVLSDGSYGRRVMMLRATTGTTVDSGSKPPVYTDGQLITAQEHVSAIGNGVIAPTNPHGLSINDVTGGGAEPENILYQKETVADGIIDLLNDVNNPIPASEALEPTIVNSPVPTTSWVVRVEFLPLVVDQHAMYISGERFTSLTPILSTFSRVPSDTQAIVGFEAGDAAGEYFLYAIKSIEGVAALDKISSTLAIPTDSLLLATVYWDGSDLRKTRERDSSSAIPSTEQQESPVRPEDDRSIGLVDKSSIATKAMVDPLLGLLSQTQFTNQALNGGMIHVAGSIGGAGRVLNWTLGVNVGVGTGTMSLLTAASDPSMYGANAPNKYTGAKMSFTPSGSNTLDARLMALCVGIKPNTKYTATVWFKLPTVNSSIMVLGAIGNATYPGPTIPGGQRRSDVQEFRLDRSIPGWQRASITLTTTASANPNTYGVLEFMFMSQNLTGIGWIPTEVWLSNVVLAEGEWSESAEYADLPIQWNIGAVATYMWHTAAPTHFNDITLTLDKVRNISIAASGSAQLWACAQGGFKLLQVTNLKGWAMDILAWNVHVVHRNDTISHLWNTFYTSALTPPGGGVNMDSLSVVGGINAAGAVNIKIRGMSHWGNDTNLIRFNATYRIT